MPRAELSELLLIAILMSVLIIISIVSIYIFIKTYKREMAEKEKNLAEKAKKKDETR